jgi:hypothetical protein
MVLTSFDEGREAFVNSLLINMNNTTGQTDPKEDDLKQWFVSPGQAKIDNLQDEQNPQEEQIDSTQQVNVTVESPTVLVMGVPSGKGDRAVKDTIEADAHGSIRFVYAPTGLSSLINTVLSFDIWLIQVGFQNLKTLNMIVIPWPAQFEDDTWTWNSSMDQWFVHILLRLDALHCCNIPKHVQIQMSELQVGSELRATDVEGSGGKAEICKNLLKRSITLLKTLGECAERVIKQLNKFLDEEKFGEFCVIHHDGWKSAKVRARLCDNLINDSKDIAKFSGQNLTRNLLEARQKELVKEDPNTGIFHAMGVFANDHSCCPCCNHDRDLRYYTVDELKAKTSTENYMQALLKQSVSVASSYLGSEFLDTLFYESGVGVPLDFTSVLYDTAEAATSGKGLVLMAAGDYAEKALPCLYAPTTFLADIGTRLLKGEIYESSMSKFKICDNASFDNIFKGYKLPIALVEGAEEEAGRVFSSMNKMGDI